MFEKPLFSNGFSIVAYVAVVVQQWVYMIQYHGGDDTDYGLLGYDAV
jgi:hypothetical protein